MGLDMYLSKRHYWSHWHEKPGVRSIECDHTSIRPERIKVIDEHIMYWRKANQIHNWFATVVAEDDEINCREIEVGIDQLRELLRAIDIVLADRSRAAELLPTAPGFFWGGLDYDDSYFADLEETKAALGPELAADRVLGEDTWFVYKADW